jgi:hypothetical protein
MKRILHKDLNFCPYKMVVVKGFQSEHDIWQTAWELSFHCWAEENPQQLNSLFTVHVLAGLEWQAPAL